MNEIQYVVSDPAGLHARPAGALVKKIKEYACDVTLTYGEKTVDAKKLFAIMGLAVKGGETIALTFSGDGADTAAEEVRAFLESL